MNARQQDQVPTVIQELRANKPRYEIIPRLITECGMTNFEANEVMDHAESNVNGATPSFGGGQQNHGGSASQQPQQGYNNTSAHIEQLRGELKQKGSGKIALGVLMIIGGIIATVLAFEGGYIVGLTIMIAVYGVVNLFKGISMLSQADRLR
jgi:hypothetical protein